MEFDIDFGKFCYNCGGKCCEQNNWWIYVKNQPRLVTVGDLRDIEKNENISLIQRNDWGFRCFHFNNKRCEIYKDRHNTCKSYICDNPIFKILDDMVINVD